VLFVVHLETCDAIRARRKGLNRERKITPMPDENRKLTRLNPQLEITHLKPEKRVGLIVVLTGYGKGKTSSALGMVFRACGHGMKVCMIQFMKGDIFTGEWEAVKKIDCDVEIVPTGMGFAGSRVIRIRMQCIEKRPNMP
jgi:ATP:corrinoid adenosyltransferase